MIRIFDMLSNPNKRKVLLCGHRSFAAQGLMDVLRMNEHDVICFSRGPVGRNGDIVTGPVMELHDNPHLPKTCDTVVNYVLLHGESVETNLEYIKSLLNFCESRSVKHLIHISSCSAYKNSARYIDEDALIESDPRKKGPYAAVKAAQETYITANAPIGLKISHIRPGLIIANGMGGYIGGIGIRLPWNSIIGLGNARSQLPLITRDAVNKTVACLVNNPPEKNIESLLLASSPSPTRREYLHYCCEVLGVGTKVRFFPVSLWLTAAFFADCMARIIGQAKLGIYSKVRSVCRFQQFNAKWSERRTGQSFSTDWPAEMSKVFDFQKKNYEIPDDSKLESILANKVTYIGFGRIVKQRHLPSLKKIGFKGEIEAFDLRTGNDKNGQVIQDIKQAKLLSSDLVVVATPSTVHIEAIEHLKNVDGPILVEKPLGYNVEELNRWLDFARSRKDPVYVCHDRRYKQNVLDMMNFMRRYNPGKLNHVSVVFQSAPVNKDSAVWLRDERRARTLLLDYGVHQIDLSCIFGQGKPSLKNCRYELNAQGETCLIEGSAAFDNCTINFLFRQGINQRRTRLIYTFQNYSITLGFAPDIFVPHMADENFGLSWLEANASIRATVSKIRDKITGRESETSHAHVLQAALSENTDHPLLIERLIPVYDLLFQISRSVYGE